MSLMAAIASGELVAAHEEYGRTGRKLRSP